MDTSDSAKDSLNLELSNTKRTDKWRQFSKTKIYETFLSIASICITYSLLTESYKGCFKSSIPTVFNKFNMLLMISGVAMAFPPILIGYSISKIYQKSNKNSFYKIININIFLIIKNFKNV
jgi:hypothetical protein